MKVRFLQTVSEIEEVRASLGELAKGSGQPEAIADIHYFLGKPGLLKRVPVLALVSQEETEHTSRDLPGSLEGAVLLFRYRVAGFATGFYTSNDRSGRRTVIAPLAKRLRVVQAVIEALEGRGAQAIMLSLRCHPDQDKRGLDYCAASAQGSKTVRQRSAPDYLELQSTYDGTLAQIGKRTRTHMRYYRKRAHEQLGCTFDPQLQLELDELLALNRESTHPLRPEVVTWRLRALSFFNDPVLVGLRDASGRLLGVVGGRRLGAETEVFWQLNHGEQRGHSLSLAIRSHLIEHEISRGARRLYLDGGSNHSLCNSFVKSTITDVAVLRRSALTYLLRKSARLLIPWDNELAHLLVATSSKSPADDQILRVQDTAEEVA